MGDLHFSASLNNKEFLSKLREIEGGVKNTASKVEQEGNAISDVFKKLKGVMTATVAGFAVKELVQKVASVRSEFQKLEISFNTMLGSKAKAQELMSQLTKTAAITPFGLQDVANGAKQLLAYGMASEKVNDTLIRLGDISAGLGVPLGDLVYLYGTTMTQGRLFTQDLRQFMGRGIPLADELAKQFGVTKDEVGDLVTSGKVGFENLEQAIVSMTSEGSKFGGLMEAQSKTIEGQISNIEDSIAGMFNEIGKSSEGVINASLGVVSFAVENWESLGKALAVVVASYGAYKAALITNIAIEQASIVSNRAKALGVNASTASVIGHTIATKAATVAQGAFNAVVSVNPYVALATAVVAVGTALWAFTKNIDAAKEAEEKYQSNKEELIRQEEEHKKKIEELISIANDEALSTDLRREAIYELAKKYPDIFAKYRTEEEILNNILNIKKEIADLDAGSSITNTVNELAAVEKRIAELEALEGKTKKTVKAGSSGAVVAEVPLLTAELTNELKNLYKKREELKGKRTQELRDHYFADLSGISNNELKEEIKKRKDLLAQMQISGADKGTIKSGRLYNVGEFSKSEIEAQLSSLEREQNKRETEGVSPAERRRKAKEEYDKAVKDLKDFYNSKKKLSDEDYKAEKKRLEENKKNAEENYKKAGGDVNADKEAQTEEERLAKEQNKLNKEKEQAERDSEDRQLKLKQDHSQAIIDAMDEGFAKEMKQLEHNYQVEKDNIDQWEKELKRKKIDEARSLFEANPDNATKVFDSSSVDTSLTDEEQEYKLQRSFAADKKYANDVKQIQKELIQGFETYEQRRQSIQEEYQKKRESLYTTDIQGNKVLREGITKGNVDELKKQEEDALKDVDLEFANRSIQFEAWANSIAEVGLWKLKEMLEEANAELEKAGENATPEQKARVAVLNQRISTVTAEQEAEDKISPKKSSYKDWQKLESVLNDVANESKKLGAEFTEMGGDFGEITGRILTDASDIASSTFTIIDSVKKLTTGSIEGMEATSEGAGKAISGVEKASVILGIITAAVQITMKIINLVKDLSDRDNRKLIEENEKRIESLQKNYDKLNDTVSETFSDAKAQKLREMNNILKYQKRLVQEQIEAEKSRKKPNEDSIEQYQEKIDGINDKIKENKESIQEAIYGESVQSAIERFADSYADAIAGGTSAWKSAKDFAKETIKQIIQEQIKQYVNGSKVIEKFRELTRQLLEDGLTAAEEQKLYEEAEKIYKDVESRYGGVNRILGEGEEANATRGTISAMSQEQGEKLDGRFLALQITGEMINESMNAVRDNVSRMCSMSVDNNLMLKEMRNLVFLSTGYLEDIANYSKNMLSFGEKLDKIETNTRGLV